MRSEFEDNSPIVILTAVVVEEDPVSIAVVVVVVVMSAAGIVVEVDGPGVVAPCDMGEELVSSRKS